MDRHGLQWRPGSARHRIDDLGLLKDSSAEAVLADGGTVELETYRLFVDWFGNSYDTQIVATAGQFPLLGTMLLRGHRLDIDYVGKTVELT